MAQVDDEDYALVAQFTWHKEVHRSPHSVRYYARRRWVEAGRRRTQYMHQLVAGCVGVDHRDHDGLNNQGWNLRPASAVQQQANRRTMVRERSRFRGVYPSKNRWMARISVAGVKHYLGNFAQDEDAARAYDRAARELHGEYALLNFPEGSDERTG